MSGQQPATASGSAGWRGYAALAAAVSGIAWSSILVRWAAIPGPASALYRVAIAGAVLIPWRLARGGRPVNRRSALLALAGGLFFGLDLALYNTAVMRTTAATASFLGNNAPIFVGLGAWLIFKRRPPGVFWAGLVLAVAGGAVMVLAHLSSGAAHGSVTGDLMAAVASIFFAGYLLSAEHMRGRMDTLTFNTIAIGGSAAVLLLVCVVIGAPLGGYSTTTWGALFALGLISQLGAYYALVYALGHLPATITSVGLLTQLPLTALLAATFLHEPITWSQIVGGALVLAGVYVVNRGGSAG